MSNKLMTLDETIKVGTIAAKSKSFGMSDENKAIVKILAGQEMGIGAIASLNGLYIFKDTIGIQSSIMAGLIKSSSKYHYNTLTEVDDDKKCEIEFFEDGKKIGVSRFTIEEAKRAELLNKDNWKKYPADMLFNRTMARGFRRFTPDLGAGPVYTPDELEIESDDYSPELIIENAPIDVDRQEWIETVIESDDFPSDESPAAKVSFINEQIKYYHLDFNPVTVPELLSG